MRTRFIELAGEINTAMPRWVVDRLAEALDGRFRKGLNGTRILVVGIAYKKNVDDMRESPALVIMDLLNERGAAVAYHDPYCPVIPPTREHRHLAGRRSVPLDPSTLADFEAAVIVTDHDGVDYGALVASVPLVVDTRNATRHVDAGPRADRHGLKEVRQDARPRLTTGGRCRLWPLGPQSGAQLRRAWRARRGRSTPNPIGRPSSEPQYGVPSRDWRSRS